MFFLIFDCFMRLKLSKKVIQIANNPIAIKYLFFKKLGIFSSISLNFFIITNIDKIFSRLVYEIRKMLGFLLGLKLENFHSSILFETMDSLF